jgi:trk system potassium uptake protein
MKKSFIVIGLGRFGESVTKTLISLGHEVMVLDKDAGKVNKFAQVATQAVQVDSTDEQVLRELGVANVDEAVVAIGDDIQASILTTLLLKDFGLYKITVKAKNDYHSQVLEKIGADRIVHAERDMAVRVAHNIMSQNVVDYMELSADFSLVEISASSKMDGRPLAELDLRAEYGATVMAIKPKHAPINISPLAEDVVRQGDLLVIIGANRDIHRLEQHLLTESNQVIV